MIEPKIIRSKRKYLTLIIDEESRLIVRAPLRCKDSEIYDFINKKQNWIYKKIQERKNRIQPLRISDGSRISILGDEFSLLLGDYKKVKVQGDNLLVPVINSHEHLVTFLKALAKKYMKTRVEEIASSFGFKYTSIRISSAKTNWGSCSYKNSLNFSYKLMLCPKSVVDYIIVHELSHTKIKNHSHAFYDLVGSIMPNYKICIKWLKQNASLVNFI